MAVTQNLLQALLKATLVISTVAFQFAQYQNHLGYPIVKMPYTSYWHELSFPPANEPLLFVFAQIFNQHRILKHLSSQPTFCSTYAILAYFGESDRSFRFYPITFSSSFSSLPVLP
jgi:hypothetical protein